MSKNKENNKPNLSKKQDSEILNDINNEYTGELEVSDSHAENLFNTRNIALTLLGIVIGIILSHTIFNATLKLTLKNMRDNVTTNTTTVISSDANGDNIDTEETIENSTVSKGVTTYMEPSVIVNDEAEIIEAQKLVDEYVLRMIENNTYSQVMTGEDSYVYYLYNENRELFSQDSDGTFTEIFLNNGTVYNYLSDGTMSVGADVDIASILSNTIHAVGNKGVTLYKMDLDETDTAPGVEYRIDLVGEDAIKLMYANMPDEFADDMYNSILTSVEDWEPHIIMAMFIGEDDADTFCYCLYVIDDTEYTNWLFQGFDYVGDWTYSEDWYSYDPEEDTDGDRFSELTLEVVNNINNIMYEYSLERGWVTEENEAITDETVGEASSDEITSEE